MKKIILKSSVCAGVILTCLHMYSVSLFLAHLLMDKTKKSLLAAAGPSQLSHSVIRCWLLSVCWLAA